MTSYGYTRISTDHQDTEMQRHALARAGVTIIYSDHAESGGTPWELRSGLAALVGTLAPGDQVVAYRLDRVTRDVGDFVSFLKALSARGAVLRSLSEGITVPGDDDELLAHVLTAVAQSERSRIRRSVKQGLAAARDAGTVLGRPAAAGPTSIMLTRAGLAAGRSVRDLARELDLSRATVRKIRDAAPPYDGDR